MELRARSWARYSSYRRDADTLHGAARHARPPLCKRGQLLEVASHGLGHVSIGIAAERYLRGIRAETPTRRTPSGRSWG
jgi:hypothetical protein